MLLNADHASTHGRSRFSREPTVPSVDRPQRWWPPAPGPSGDQRVKLRIRCGLGQLDSDRVVPVLGLEVLLGLVRGVLRSVSIPECTAKDRKRCEQKITSFGTLNRQCSRWRSIASVIDRLRTPPTHRARRQRRSRLHHELGPDPGGGERDRIAEPHRASRSEE